MPSKHQVKIPNQPIKKSETSHSAHERLTNTNILRYITAGNKNIPSTKSLR